ncbi:MAG: phenylalanine--tRNA ligase subunit alpha [Candidatus Anstonellaceae archaeon]
MLHQIESKILSSLSSRMSAQELASACNLPLDSVLSFSQSLRDKGYVSISQEEKSVCKLTSEGTRFLSEKFPEERVYAAALKSASLSSLTNEERTVGVAWATKNGWVKITKGELSAASAPEEPYSLAEALQKISSGNAPSVSQDIQAILSKRKLVSQSTAKTIFLEPTAKDYSAELPDAASPASSPSGAVNLLTREMLLSGSWQNALFRKYDVSAPAELPLIAKRHMVSRLRRRISRIFTDMGFEEMEGPQVQSSFWNFDALFQPQDHPARDLADTFYLKGNSPLPEDAELVSKIKKVHEKCWGGEWKEENACKPVLRTHTTAVSAYYLYNFCKGNTIPKKYFSIGKVFRNEATDYKHLAEFFQVEGIVVWEGATFRNLLGCLKEFYRKLGFEKIRFQPSYFPYTEPSLEISVYFEKKKQWMELGGAGIFRPEVSIPLCDRYPVLAWGLSLERPLMLLNDMEDIRDFYKSNVGWLRRQKVQ